MTEQAEESANNQGPVNDVKRFIWTGVCVAVLSSVFVGICLFMEVAPRKTAIAVKPEKVEVPEYFAVYESAIRQADMKVIENSSLMNDVRMVTLENLNGFFRLPLRRSISYSQIRVPGDPREYRKGVHQGIDFYGIRGGDPVYAAAPGIVLRIDRSYSPLDKKWRNELLGLCESKWNGTPGAVGCPPAADPHGNVLDKLSGRQVILYHGKNLKNEPVISLYAHLSEVNQKLAPGDIVAIDSIVGYVGNSGTSGEVNHSAGSEIHLHMELFVGGMYWTPKRQTEVGRKQNNGREAELQQMVLNELSADSQKEYPSSVKP